MQKNTFVMLLILPLILGSLPAGGMHLIEDRMIDHTGFSTTDEGWNIETVDAIGDVGWYTDIAFGQDALFISYYDLGDENLKVAQKTGETWDINVVDSSGMTGKFSSIAVDSSGRPHVSYFDESNQDLKYATQNNALGWETQTVDSTGNLGYDTSIAVDSTDQPHISYGDRTNGEVKHAWRTAEGWRIEVVDEGNTGYGTAIVLDDNDQPHISYTDASAETVYYAWKTNDAWSISTVESDIRVYGSTTLDVAANQPHIAYYDIAVFDQWRLKYATLRNDQWVVEIVDPDLYQFYNEWGVSITVQDDIIHLAYYKWEGWNVNYAWKPSWGSWMIETVDAEGFVGAYTAMTLDDAGYPHVSYMQNDDLDVKHAWKTQYAPSIPQTPSGPGRGRPGSSYTYSTRSVDLDGDLVRYGWDWDDGSEVEWTEYYDSNAEVSIDHSWEEKGDYQVRVIAEDDQGHQSDWSEPLRISMPKNQLVSWVFHWLKTML